MNMCPSYKRKVPPELCLKGQVFFIWSNQQSLQFVQYQISLLGGRIDSFLSKDITTILIEDTQLIAAQYYPADLAVRQAYAANGIAESYTHPGIVYNLPSTSRGYSLLASSTSVNSPLRVITFARQWGIQVLGIAYFLSYIDPIVKSIAHLIHPPKKSQSVSPLNGCFLKFECFQNKFRPCYKMFNSDPERLLPMRNNLSFTTESCRVYLERTPKTFPFNHMDINNKSLFVTRETKPTVKANDKKYPNKLKPKEENNYCECCRTHFSDLTLHIESANHLKFVANGKNYDTVNNIIKMLPSAQEFMQMQLKPAPTSEAVVQNGESLPPEVVDFSMPLNLHVKKVEAPVIHFPGGPFENHSPLNLHVTRPDEIQIPLDLHVKHIDVKVEMPKPLPVVEPLTLAFPNEGVVKSEIDVVGDSPPENLAEPKMEDKDFCIPQVTDVLPNDPLPSVDPGIDKTNPAQMYLKNFDSYWLDSLPCEMDDMIFDDNIFDFDDGKQKFPEQVECAQPIEPFPVSDIPQSPCLVSGISTDLKMQSTVTTSLMNSPIDMKDVIKPELTNVPETFSPVCKTEHEFKNCLSPAISEKKFSGTFDIKADANPFYDDKQNMDISPPCPNAMAMKSAEQMFSSDSSDDENESVFISNVLNIITTHSDNEMKVDRVFLEEDSNSNSKSVSKHKLSQPSTSSTKLANTETTMSTVINSDISEASTAVMNPGVAFIDPRVAPVKSDDTTYSGPRVLTTQVQKTRSVCVDSELSCTSTLAASFSSNVTETYASSITSNTTTSIPSNHVNQSCIPNVSYPECTVPERTCTSIQEPVPHPVPAVDKTLVNNSMHHYADCELPSKIKASDRSGKDISNNSMHRYADCEPPSKTKASDKSGKDISNNSMHHYVDCELSSKTKASDKSGKDISNNSMHHYVDCELSSKTKASNRSGKDISNNSMHHYANCELSSKTKASKRSGKDISNNSMHHHADCEFPSKTKASDRSGKDISAVRNYVSANKKPFVSVQPSSTKSLEKPKRQKTLHKKPARKLKKLPALWSVSILPGKGVKLKFRCIQPESFEPVESDEDVKSSMQTEFQ